MSDSIIKEDMRSVKSFPSRIRPGEAMSLAEFKQDFGISDRTLARWKRAIFEKYQRDFIRGPGCDHKWVFTDDIFYVLGLEELPKYEPEYKWRQ
ncbi:MAG: hypothetical protein HUJ26_05165 [Planctomycetaceae bacterium]|nr:hypothetical protein [Planctomycetaceae bacterium]